MGDESWIYGYDSDTKQQSSQGKCPQLPRAKKAQQVRRSTKSMHVVHHESVPPNTTVNSDFYCDVSRHLREHSPWKRQNLWCNHNWLHHDNAPTHISLKTSEFVTNNNMVIVSHPPYSPDLACDYALFTKLIMKLKGWRIETVSDIQSELQVVLNSIKENYFHSAFEAWKKRWDCCILS
jgi:histone-lysine N-methyltransferase SETMAR